MFRTFKKFCANTDGGTLPLFTIVVPSIIGALAVSVEAAYWYKSKSDMQMVVDMAAYAGAIDLATGVPADDAKIAAQIDALHNGYDVDLGTITVNIPPTSGATTSANAVEVIMTQKGNQYFSKIFGNNRITYRNRSVAEFFKGADACMLALNTTESGSFTATGSTTLDLDNCAVGVNSDHNEAAILGGSASITADCLSVVGGIDGAENGTFDCGTPFENGQVIINPYEDLEAPDLADYPSCISPVDINGWDQTMAGGRYCSNITIKGTTFLDNNSTFIFDGIDVKFIGADSEMIGSEVTLILMNGASLTGVNGGSDINISAPLSGDYKGIAIYSDPVTQTANEVVKLNGGTSTSIEGLLYFPTQDLEFSGNTTGTNACTIIVADTIDLSGSSELTTTGCDSNFDLEKPYINRGTFLVQ